MKGKLRRLGAALLVFILVLGTTPAMAAGEDGLDSDAGSQGLTGVGDWWEEQTGGDDNSDTQPPDAGDEDKQYNTTPQLTEEDLIRMNRGVVTIQYSEDGYLTFLQGTYYEGKVLNEEDAIASLAGMASLLGLGKGSEFYGVFGYQTASGYTIYTYQQRYGDKTLENAVLKVIVDPNGYTAGLVSSFTPNVGIAPDEEPLITAEEAEQIVRKRYPDEDLTVFSDYTRQTSVTLDGVANHVWAVFTNYPASAGESDRAYLEHYVGYEGSYLLHLAVTSPEEFIPGDNALSKQALEWFEDKEPATWTVTVRTHNGRTETLTVPVVKDQDGVWYLADAQRNILLADYYTMVYGNMIDPWTSDHNGDWQISDAYLLTYATYIKVYDFFAQFGYESIDGFGAPILLLTDMCDADHVPEDNACYIGSFGGWEVVGASDVNDYGECVDVCAHEFTHGIKRYATTGNLYQNESGAVDEAISDVIGNLCEMLLGETTDTQWLIAENSGQPLRNMSFPWEYMQPVKVGGRYYIPSTEVATIDNDAGGVHTNSSLVNQLAWSLYALGMDPQEEYYLWMEAVNLMTPYSGFKEVHAALLFAADMLELDVQWFGRIDMLCEQLGF